MQARSIGKAFTVPELCGNGAVEVVVFEPQGGDVWHCGYLSWNGPTQLQAESLSATSDVHQGQTSQPATHSHVDCEQTADFKNMQSTRARAPRLMYQCQQLLLEL